MTRPCAWTDSGGIDPLPRPPPKETTSSDLRRPTSERQSSIFSTSRLERDGEPTAEQGWASTTSEERTRRYTPDDWKALKAEQAAVYEDAHSALRAGERPSDEAVMAIAERHRLSIDRWFYPCSHGMHCGLASMYESDDRFKQTIDRHGQAWRRFSPRQSAQMQQGIRAEVIGPCTQGARAC